jgi:hypothetical protein
LFLTHSLRRVAVEVFGQAQLCFNLSEEFAVFAGLRTGEEFWSFSPTDYQ